MIGQRHLGGRESSHALERVETENAGEVMLPRAHVKTKILHGCRRRHGMAPRSAQPLDTTTIGRTTSNRPQLVDHVVQPHLPHAVQQTSRVLQHDPRLFPIADQLRNELAHPLVAPVKNGRVVIVADVGVVHHVFEVADHLGRLQIVATGRDQRLMHMQRVGEAAVGAAQVDATFRQVEGTRLRHRFLD